MFVFDWLLDNGLLWDFKIGLKKEEPFDDEEFGLWLEFIPLLLLLLLLVLEEWFGDKELVLFSSVGSKIPPLFIWEGECTERASSFQIEWEENKDPDLTRLLGLPLLLPAIVEDELLFENEVADKLFWKFWPKEWELECVWRLVLLWVLERRLLLSLLFVFVLIWVGASIAVEVGEPIENELSMFGKVKDSGDMCKLVIKGEFDEDKELIPVWFDWGWWWEGWDWELEWEWEWFRKVEGKVPALVLWRELNCWSLIVFEGVNEIKGGEGFKLEFE